MSFENEDVKIHGIVPCPICNGIGRDLNTFETCPECLGNGKLDIFISLEELIGLIKRTIQQ